MSRAERVVKIRNGVKISGIGAASVLVFILMAAGRVPLAAQSQDEGTQKMFPFSFGLFGGYGLTLYSGEIDLGTRTEIGGGTCGILDGGGGGGPAGGAFVEYRLSPSTTIGLRGLLEDQSGVMTLDLPVSHHRLPSSAVVEIASQYRLDLDVIVQTVELYAGLRPFSFPMRLYAGPTLGIPSSPTYEFTEEIEGHEDVTFENGTRSQQYASGGLEANFLYGLHVGADYRLPMGGGLELQPAITIYSYLNGLIQGSEGPVISGVRPSLGIHYRISRPEPDPPILLAEEPSPPPPPPTPEAEQVVLGIDAIAIGPEGESGVVTLQVDVKSKVREIPLLPYVFFERVSSDLPERYRRGILPSGNPPGVEVYRHILDIVGDRMARIPGSITLVGTTDGSAAESGVERLALDRAESVGRYLIDRWGIDPDRVTYRAQGLPEDRANPALEGAAAENRRVEIRSDAGYLRPWRVVDSTRLVDAPEIIFRPRQTSGLPVNNWRLDLRSAGRPLRNVVGASRLPERVVVEPTAEERATMLRGDSLEYRFSGENDEGMSDTISGRMPVVMVRRSEERPMLEGSTALSTPVLFGYNSAELTPDAREVLEAFRRRIPEGAILRIIGYADDLGGSEYNRALSRRRAEAVATLFPEADTTIVAAGEVSSRGADTTPEARYYARTVRIEVEK